MKDIHSNYKGVLISDSQFNGPDQMAADVLMLEQIILKEEISIAVRFYTWNKPCLSLGKNQKNFPLKWVSMARSGEIDLVRRPSGGGAVLHSGGLTYSIAWQSPPRGRLRAYFLTSQWLINCFKELGINLNFGKEDTLPAGANCFARATYADLVDQYGCKRIGSAQTWKRGNLLQHGEIILYPPKDLWLEIFNSNPPEKLPIEISQRTLEEMLIMSLKQYWSSLKWSKEKLKKKYLDEIKTNASNYLVNF